MRVILLGLWLATLVAASHTRRWLLPSTPTLVVNTTQTFQTVDGFGFCEAFQRANALYNAPENVQDSILALLFDKATGAGLSILRIGLGSSPNSTKDHMNSIEPESPSSPAPNSPTVYTWDHNASGQVWMARRAQGYGINMFYADAWSAPGYMKTNGRDDDGGYLCGVQGQPCASGNWVVAYVDYLVMYVKLYLAEGIPLRYIGFVNEPNLRKPYATMFSDGGQAADVIRPLRAALTAANLSSVGVSCCEGQGWSMQRDMIPALQSTIDDGNLSLITTHAYKGEPAAPDRPLHTGLNVWITENSPIMQQLGFSETWYRNGSENEGLTWANNIQTALTVGNVSAYLYWIGVGPWAAEVPLIWIPQKNESQPVTAPGLAFRVAATYWATAHWSRFIRPSAVRIGTEVSSLGVRRSLNTTAEALRSSAYHNPDGSVVVQVINNSDRNLSMSLAVPWETSNRNQRRTVTSWVTDNSRSLAKMGSYVSSPIGDGPVTVTTPRSLTTFVIQV